MEAAEEDAQLWYGFPPLPRSAQVAVQTGCVSEHS